MYDNDKENRKEAEDGAYYNRVHSETQWKGCEKRGEESSNEHGDSGFATMNKEKRKGIFSFSQSTSGTPPYSPTSTAI